MGGHSNEITTNLKYVRMEIFEKHAIMKLHLLEHALGRFLCKSLCIKQEMLENPLVKILYECKTFCGKKPISKMKSALWKYLYSLSLSVVKITTLNQLS